MTSDSSGFDVERQRVAREVFTLRMRIGVLRTAVFAAAVFLFLVLGGSRALRDATAGGSPWVSVVSYVTVLYLALWVADLPFSANGHRLDRRYGLSRQAWRGWALDDLKSLALGFGFTLVAVEVLYGLLRATPAWWWLTAWLLAVAVSLAAGIVAPVLLVRIFYKVTPLADADLEARLRALAQRAGIRVLGVYVVRTSAKSSRSNAALAGAGRTRRIVLTDTLLQSHTPDEIETILAHELAHQKHRDPAVGFAEFALTTLATLAVLGALLPWAVGPLSLDGVADPAGLPALMLLAATLGFLFGPAEAALSRRREARADRAALELTGKPDAFASAMVKLHDANLSLARPPRLVELLAMSHPAAWRRVAGARAFRGRALK
jgi:STE24 endopeptidase